METAGSGVKYEQKSAHKWTDEDTEWLIRWRGQNEALFRGRRNAALKGFDAFFKEHGLEGQVLKAPLTGVSIEGGEATAANWKWFNIMDEVMRDRPAITPPNLITSSITPAAVASPPNPPSESPPVRVRRTSDSRSREWFEEWVKEFKEREDERIRQAEERERRAGERKRQEKREMEERWVRREREWREEERKNTDRREREWREWMDRRAMEERREREERERESRVREERWMELIERLFNSK
ncbi:uncharacterized protein LOC122971204 [Xyrichtys novacula]|uniref:Uncharacterized protein LOC122971204 n=1 Tax=Xyrichtys novacula TaxID=13765 RepID=A0AAV1GNT3_XYRNO|nr:uncharacterized protein LOC122971204 [Xyrichtys novacula]